jgi:hypothetical protein
MQSQETVIKNIPDMMKKCKAANHNTNANRGDNALKHKNKKYAQTVQCEFAAVFIPQATRLLFGGRDFGILGGGA